MTAEVAPHHFTLTEDAVNGDDANFKINPPLRKADDVKALKEALASGLLMLLQQTMLHIILLRRKDL